MHAWFGYGFSALFAVVLVCAGVVDARTRRLPNPLALALVASAFGASVALNGPGAAAAHLLCASACFLILMCLELLWRRVTGRAGLGMGDVKALFGIMLIDPPLALFAFGASLLALAACALAARVSSLPLLPFLAGAFLVPFGWSLASAWAG